MAADILLIAWRGAINQVTDEDGLRHLISQGGGLYVGVVNWWFNAYWTFDSFMILKVSTVGHKPVLLLVVELVQLTILQERNQNVNCHKKMWQLTSKNPFQMVKLFGENELQSLTTIG